MNPEANPVRAASGRVIRRPRQLTPKKQWSTDSKRRLRTLLVVKAYKEIKESQKDKRSYHGALCVTASANVVLAGADTEAANTSEKGAPSEATRGLLEAMMAANTRCLSGTVEVPLDALNYNIEELRQELIWSTGN